MVLEGDLQMTETPGEDIKSQTLRRKRKSTTPESSDLYHQESMGKSETPKSRKRVAHDQRVIHVVFNSNNDVASVNSGLELVTERSDFSTVIMPSRDYKNQRVVLSDGKEGIVEYVGAVHFLPGVVLGVHLDDQYEGVCNGTIHGWKYFKTPPNKAVFVKKNQVRLVSSPAPTVTRDEKEELSEQVSIPKVSEDREIFGDDSEDHEEESSNISSVEIESRVQLVDGRVGTVRFLGPVHFQSGILAGLELDPPQIGENDGSVMDWRYFHCPPRRGVFVKREELRLLISEKNKDLDSEEARKVLQRKRSTLGTFRESQPSNDKKMHVISPATGCGRKLIYTIFYFPCFVKIYDLLALYVPILWSLLDHATDILVIFFFYKRLPILAGSLFMLNILTFGIRWFVSIRFLQQNRDMSSLPYWKAILLIMYITPIGIPISFLFDLYHLFHIKKYTCNPDIEQALNQIAFHHLIQIVTQSVPSCFIITFISYFTAGEVSVFFTYLLLASFIISISHSILFFMEIVNQARQNGFYPLEHFLHRMQFPESSPKPPLPYSSFLTRNKLKHVNYSAHAFRSTDIDVLEHIFAPVATARSNAHDLESIQLSPYSFSKLAEQDIYRLGQAFVRRTRNGHPLEINMLGLKSLKSFQKMWSKLDQIPIGCIWEEAFLKQTTGNTKIFDQLSEGMGRLYERQLFDQLLFRTSGMLEPFHIPLSQWCSFSVDHQLEGFLVFCVSLGLHKEGDRATVVSQTGKYDLLSYILTSKDRCRIRFLCLCRAFDPHILERSVRHHAELKRFRSLKLIADEISLHDELKHAFSSNEELDIITAICHIESPPEFPR